MTFAIPVEENVSRDIEVCPEDFEFFISEGRLMANIFGVHTPVFVAALPEGYEYLFEHMIVNIKKWKLSEGLISLTL